MSDIDLDVWESEIQQSFGRYMLRLQEYELLVKTLVTNQELKGTVSQLDLNKLKRTEEFATDSLGSLVKKFLKSHVTIEGAIEAPLLPEDIKDISEPMLGFRRTMQMSEVNHAKLKNN